MNTSIWWSSRWMIARDSLLRGSLSVSDVFRVLSLGLGTDGKAGYPLVAFHITGKDVKKSAGDRNIRRATENGRPPAALRA